jgi:plasmid replication initiation protein
MVLYPYRKTEVIFMRKDVVRYNNGLNSVPLRSFTPVDMDLFWGICSKMKRKETKIENISFDELKQMIHYNPDKRGTSFTNKLADMSDKLGRLFFVYEDEHIYDRLNLFQRFTINKDRETLSIQVSDDFDYILNSIGKNFTRFELETMTTLSSSYVKELYRQLMAHRDNNTRSGGWFVKMGEFRQKLAIPASYRMTDIDRQIIKRAEKEFCGSNKYETPVFSKFRVQKIKASKGNKVTSLRFYFTEYRDPSKPRIPLYKWSDKPDN